MKLFYKVITISTKQTIRQLLDIIRFRMSSTPIAFNRECYGYHGEEKKEQGLAIGGYELAFIYDLLSSYLFQIQYTLILKKYHKNIYRDGGMVVFRGVHMCARY